MEATEEPLVTRRDLTRVFLTDRTTALQALEGFQAAFVMTRGRHAVMDSFGTRTLRLFSELNFDAVSAARHEDLDLARRFATSAAEIESSPAATEIIQALPRAGDRVAAFFRGHRPDDQWTDELRRYLDVRLGSAWDATNRQQIAWEWVCRSDAWLRSDDSYVDALEHAVASIAKWVNTVRRDTYRNADREALHRAPAIGRVVHVDPEGVEVHLQEGPELRLPRWELDREGLTRIGRWVSLLPCTVDDDPVWLARPAVQPSAPTTASLGEHQIRPFSPAGATWVVGDEDARRLRRLKARRPTVLSDEYASE